MRSEISIIGTGAVGGTLARALAGKGFRLKSLYNRTGERAISLADELSITTRGEFPEAAEALGQLVILAVPDGEIEAVANRLSRQLAGLSGKIVAHCSGNETSALLNPIRRKGARVAAFQPLQTFHRSSPPEAFEEIYITLEGDTRAVELLSKIAIGLGAKPFPVQAEAKPYLHAAGVVVCNYMFALAGMAQEISRLGNLDPGEIKKALYPLMRTTLENTLTDDLSTVLSGPVARGDAETVRSHLKILEQDEDLMQLYKLLGTYLLKLSGNGDRNRSESHDRIEKLLSR